MKGLHMAQAQKVLRMRGIERAEDAPRGTGFKAIEAMFINSRRRGTVTANGVNRERSIKNYESDLRYLWDFLKLRKRECWNDVTRDDINEFVDWVQKAAGWREASQYKMFRTIRALFYFILNDDECNELGMKQFLRQLPKIPKNPTRPFIPQTADLRLFANSFDKSKRAGLRNATALGLLLDCGLRIGEVRMMTVDKLHLDERRPFALVPVEGKTGERVSWLTPDTVADLRKWMRRRETFAKCEYIFVSEEGHQAGPSMFQQAFAAHRKRLGLQNGVGVQITPHTLRHYFATDWIRRGGDIRKLKEMTGHKRLETLDVYLHLAGDSSVADEQARVSPRRGIMNVHQRGPIKPRTTIKLKEEPQ